MASADRPCATIGISVNRSRQLLSQPQWRCTMRRIVVTGLIVFSALTLTWVGGASGQRVPEVAAATTRATQVEVTNFPAVQGITGTVNVGNLPAVQNVSGTVAVGNLPVDVDG